MDKPTDPGHLIIYESQTLRLNVGLPPGDLFLISGVLGDVASKPNGLSGEFGGNIILQIGHERRECMRFTPDGKVYVRGELVEENKEVLEAFKGWLRSCHVSVDPARQTVVSSGD